MTPLFVAVLCAVMVGTAFLSGLFGMAGGLVLMGVLLVLLPLPDAMALHAVTQMASNGWRALLWWRHVRWSAVWAYMAGCALALALWSALRFVPDKPLALLFLGLGPFVVRLLPNGFRPDPERPTHGLAYGGVCMSLLLLTGVAGPLLDSFFLGGRGGLDRRGIVATKAVCQTFGHGVKLLYFGALIEQAGSVDPALAGAAILASMAGTTLARRFLEAMTDRQYRLWANRLVTAIAGWYVLHGTWLLVAGAAA
jgi:uncharacterized membrane protein YfcA